MKVLIDCGASDGAAIKDLENNYGSFEKIYAIEPNSECIVELEKLTNKSINIIQKLVCTKKGMQKLFIGDHFIESSMFVEKTTGNLKEDKYIEVECLDFDDWIKKNINQDDEVVCKMDIEGAEFDVLESILNRGGSKYIDFMLVEWHVSRLPNPWFLRFRRLIIILRFMIQEVKIKTWQ